MPQLEKKSANALNFDTVSEQKKKKTQDGCRKIRFLLEGNVFSHALQRSV